MKEHGILLDHDRERRIGFDEAIFCASKSVAQLEAIAAEALQTGARRLFTRLRRIGITRRETGRTVTAQIALVFLLPFAVGGVHALVALNSLGTMLLVNVVGYSLVVIALFGLVQLVFFALTRWTYLRALRVRA